MTISYKDMVRVSTISEGTGSLVSAATAVVGPRGEIFKAPVLADNGKTFDIRVFAVDGNGIPTGAWEECESVYTHATLTWTRGTLLDSSTVPPSRISFAAGTKHIAVTVSATTFTHFVYSTTDPIVSNAITIPYPLTELAFTGGGGLTITSTRDSALAGNITFRHYRTGGATVPAQAGDRGGTIYFDTIDSAGVEQISGEIYAAYVSDNYGVMYIAVNNTPDRVVTISSGGAANNTGLGCFLAAAGLTRAAASIHAVSAHQTFVAGIFQGTTSQSANLTEWQDRLANVLSTVSENGYFTTRKTAAPADGELDAGEAAFWFDSTNGAAKLMVKAKTANGTVVSGNIALS